VIGPLWAIFAWKEVIECFFCMRRCAHTAAGVRCTINPNPSRPSVGDENFVDRSFYMDVSAMRLNMAFEGLGQLARSAGWARHPSFVVQGMPESKRPRK
jgi:hypothetical protein